MFSALVLTDPMPLRDLPMRTEKAESTPCGRKATTFGDPALTEQLGHNGTAVDVVVHCQLRLPVIGDSGCVPTQSVRACVDRANSNVAQFCST